MNINFYVSSKEGGNFVNSCEAIIRGVGAATKQATTDACEAIKRASLAEVPRDTGTLASTFWYSVEPDYQNISGTTLKSGYVSPSRYVGYLGYAGAGRTKGQFNKTLIRGSGERSDGGGSNDDYSPVTLFKKMQSSHNVGGSSGQAYRKKRVPGRTFTQKSYNPANRKWSKDSDGNEFTLPAYDGKWKYNGTFTRSTPGHYAKKKVGLIKGHGVGDAINPKNGLPASAYAAVVHEDLDMPHPRGGKAKFLEDPVRNYAASKFKNTVTHYWKYAINYYTFSSPTGKHLANVATPMYMETKFTTGGNTYWKGDTL